MRLAGRGTVRESLGRLLDASAGVLVDAATRSEVVLRIGSTPGTHLLSGIARRVTLLAERQESA